MKRKVPGTSSEEIDLYLQTIYSLLRSSTEVGVRALEEVHAATESSLHPNARKARLDTSAFIYSILRLPDCIWKVRSLILGQNAMVFARNGYTEVENWQQVSARARRRRCFYNGKNTLACYIASRSDIDDVIPNLVALQIEWNKFNHKLQAVEEGYLRDSSSISEGSLAFLAKILNITPKELNRFAVIWGDSFFTMLLNIRQHRLDFKVRLLSSSLSEYWRATRAWWDNIQLNEPLLRDRPVYFISSNMHSISNVLSGFALANEEKLMVYLHHSENTALLAEWESIQKQDSPARKENFLYYLLKKYQQSVEGNQNYKEQVNYEFEGGISRIPSEHSFDVDAQVIYVNKLEWDRMDPRLQVEGLECLRDSEALILNIDYPLGLAAYTLLCMVAENVCELAGIYIMGKSAILNGVSGDILIPNVVHDEHSKNTYLFENAFTAPDVSPYLVFGNVLDNQKSVSVLGTFLQNKQIMDIIYREGYTDIEMEAGPYLSAVYEIARPKRHPVDEVVTLYGAPLDIGILHYASDKPMSKGRNLGAGTLSYTGIDSTYAASIAILRRIFKLEKDRLTHLPDVV